MLNGSFKLIIQYSIDETEIIYYILGYYIFGCDIRTENVITGNVIH